MDISKLSRHTKQAKEKIFDALKITDSPKFNPTSKRISINVSNGKEILETINNILKNWSKTINEKEIDTELVIKNICGENGAAKKLANSMLIKNKESGAGFKKLVFEQLKEIKSEDGLRGLEKEKIKKIEDYIDKKKRGKDGKDAREIDFLKLLCAALVLAAIDKSTKEKDEQAQKQTGLNVKLIRTVGNVENMEANDLRYVISENETELIIYPNFAGDNILLKYVANHLYRIAGKNKSHYPDGNNTFPAQKTYRIGKYDKDKLNNIKQANEKRWISNWEGFKKKGLDGFIHSLGADGNFSDQWLTYGEAIEMTEEGWNEILDKRAKEKAKKKAEEARKKDEAEEKARKEEEAKKKERLKKEEEERLRKEEEERLRKEEEERLRKEEEERLRKKEEERLRKEEEERLRKEEEERLRKEEEERLKKEEEERKRKEEERLRKEEEERLRKEAEEAEFVRKMEEIAQKEVEDKILKCEGVNKVIKLEKNHTIASITKAAMNLKNLVLIQYNKYGSPYSSRGAIMCFVPTTDKKIKDEVNDVLYAVDRSTSKHLNEYGWGYITDDAYPDRATKVAEELATKPYLNVIILENENFHPLLDNYSNDKRKQFIQMIENVGTQITDMRSIQSKCQQLAREEDNLSSLDKITGNLTQLKGQLNDKNIKSFLDEMVDAITSKDFLTTKQPKPNPAKIAALPECDEMLNSLKVLWEKAQGLAKEQAKRQAEQEAEHHKARLAKREETEHKMKGVTIPELGWICKTYKSALAKEQRTKKEQDLVCYRYVLYGWDAYSSRQSQLWWDLYEENRDSIENCKKYLAETINGLRASLEGKGFSDDVLSKLECLVSNDKYIPENLPEDFYDNFGTTVGPALQDAHDSLIEFSALKDLCFARISNINAKPKT